MLPLIEPWASKYVEAIQASRFGDAVWARYQIEGGVKNGIIQQSNMTVLDSIIEDAVGYKLNSPEQYAEAVTFYAGSSPQDGHLNVIDAITHISAYDLDRFQSLDKRASFSTSCSRNFLAFQSDCQSLLQQMYKSKVLIGDTRLISSYGGCRLRVGPYRSAADMTYRTVYAASLIIEEKCAFSQGCCYFVSGWSPKNSGHRKICLSSKRTGCS
ncbi:hypothetical protein ACHAPU_004666 [Fusarium lateritium]